MTRRIIIAAAVIACTIAAPQAAAASTAGAQRELDRYLNAALPVGYSSLGTTRCHRTAPRRYACTFGVRSVATGEPGPARGTASLWRTRSGKYTVTAAGIAL
jgi:hypothetical protein